MRRDLGASVFRDRAPRSQLGRLLDGRHTSVCPWSLVLRGFWQRNHMNDSGRKNGGSIEIATSSAPTEATPFAHGGPLAGCLSARHRRTFRPTIFIECTHTYHSDSNTGIQRVVRNVVRHAPAWAQGGKYDVVPVIWTAERFVAIKPDRVLSGRQVVHTTSNKKKLGFGKKFLRESIRPFRRFASMYFVSSRLTPRRLAQIDIASIVYELPNKCDFSNCVLLLLDSSWTYNIWPLVTSFQRQGGTIVNVIYDLIPLSNPGVMDSKEMCDAFAYWFDKITLSTDGVVAISETMADSVRHYIESASGCYKAPSFPILHFYLGSELDLVKRSDGVDNNIRNIFDLGTHVFIVVGSIEPRKNHKFILDAFDRFWAKDGNATLVLIGREGWRNEDTLERIANHPRLGTQLYLLRSASDTELDFCYCNASALLFASIVEGFGLPIVEAFQRGLPVICSDIAIFREIASGRARFFDLSSADNLVRELEDFCRSVDLSSRKNRVPQKWIAWQESVEQLLNNVLAIHGITAKKRSSGSESDDIP